MIDDLALEDEDDGQPAPSPAFYSAPAATEPEMLLIEQMHRTGARPEFRGAGLIVFTHEDEESGAEIWEEGSAALWRNVMQWPRLPTIDEAMAWQRNANARLEVRFWDRIEAARAGQA